MFEKLLIGIILGLMSISFLLLKSNVYFAYSLLLVASLLSVSQYARLLFTVASRLSFFLSNGNSTSSKQMLIAAAAKITQQQEMNQLVIREIEKIGANSSLELSEKIDSHAARALTQLNEKLEAYKKEEAIRNWSMEGIAFLSDLRKSINGTDDFASHVIAYLVRYLGANQGAFYVLREEEGDDPVLELTACYAYGKRKHTDKKITISTGKGQLGQCVQEKNIIFLTQVPSDYIRITSGLGEATPTCILIAPLVFRDHVYGAVEIASFHVLEDYQIDFSRKVCVNIAAELAAMMIHENTEHLLKQTMQAQEQMKKKEHQITAKLLEVEAERSKNTAILNACMDGVISFDEQGYIGFANAAAEELFNSSQQELLKTDIRNLIGINIVRNRHGEYSILSPSGNEITVRTEVTIKNNELSLLLTSAKVKMNEGYLFTLFIQKISVELF